MITEYNNIMNWTGRPKTEKEDAEIEAYAKIIKEANDKKMIQIKNLPVYNPIANRLVAKPVEMPTSEDWNSVKGQFGWTEIKKTVIPYLIRSGEKYVSQKMADMKLFHSYDLLFTNEVCDCFRMPSFQATRNEAVLLNEINIRHCDKYYGSENFVEGSPLSRLEDVVEKSEFLDFCMERLIVQNGSNTMRGGFVKIGNVNCVPYVCMKGKKYVPLFYFEGECNYLEERSFDLEGWDLAYLRLACKIQGIRKDLFEKVKVPVVELDLVKKFFLPGTNFVEFWQFENKVDHLIKETVDALSSTVKERRINHTGRKTIQIRQKPNEVIRENNLPKVVNPLPAIRLMVQNMSTQYQQKNSYQNPQNIPTNVSVPNYINYNNHGNWTNTNRTSLPYNNSASTAIRASTYYPTVGTTNVGTVYTLPHMTQPSNMHLFENHANPYRLYKSQVENIFLNYCVNVEPYSDKSLLVTLEEIGISLFRTSLDSIVKAVNGMYLDIYQPNHQQLQVLQKYNIMVTRGMIRVDSLRDNLPQLKFILKLP